MPVDWQEPPWNAPLDDKALLRAVPADATMTGMFLEAVASVARDKGQSPPSARERYTPFRAYPLREHCVLLLEVAKLAFPLSTTREALRRLGRGAPNVLERSTVGKVVFGSANGALAMLRAMARSYALHMRPGRIEVEEVGEKTAIVHLSEIHNFLDSHNVGVFEGTLKHAGVRGTVKIRSYSRIAADLLCEW